MLEEFHMLFTNNSSYGKPFMACTIRNSRPNSWVGSWKSKYHFLVLGDKHILSNLAFDSRILEEASRT
jgi:hypothetical protein